jgi:hypothetical protein
VETLTLFPAVLLGAAGVATLGVLLWLLARGFGFRRTCSTRSYRRAVRRLTKADTLIEREQWAEAMRELEKAVVLDTAADRQLISLLQDHHQNVLSRFLLIAEENSCHPDNSPLLERLFIERNELLTLYAKADEAYRRLQSKRTQAGKELPSWSRTDFDKRSAEILEALRTNRMRLVEELSKLTLFIEAPPHDEQVTYH